VETKRFNEAVKRNLARFPADFMFQLSAEELAALRSHSATSNAGGRGGRRYLPRAFTEHGAIMAASVLNSPRAISRNTRVQLKQVFDALRELMAPPDPPKRPIGFVRPDERKEKSPGKRR